MEYMESKMRDLIQGGIDEQNEPPQTPEAFTRWVGAPTFAEAVAVTLRTKSQDEDKIAEMFTTIKTLALERDALTMERDEARAELNKLTEGACHICGGKTRSIWCSAIHEQDLISRERDSLSARVAELEAERDAVTKERNTYGQQVHDWITSDKRSAELAALTKERDEAKAYATRLRGAINGSGPRDVDYAIALEKQRDTLSARVAELEAAVEQLRKDGERLDWLEKTGRLPLLHENAIGQAHETYRAAIDSAMSPDSNPKQP